MYNIVLTRQAIKDAQKLEQSGLKLKTITLLQIIRIYPFQNPPPYEKLQGYQDTYSRRINMAPYWLQPTSLVGYSQPALSENND
jgi:Txe/YoeB family toxin of Txe-Axe toxin-antitoxin module